MKNKIGEQVVNENNRKTSFKNIDELEKIILDNFYELELEECEIIEMIDEVIKFLAYGGDFTQAIINNHLKEKGLNFLELEGYSLELVLTLFKVKTGRDVKFASFEQSTILN